MESYEIISPSVHVKDKLSNELLKKLEWAGRVCYKSDEKITDDSYVNFLESKLNMKPVPHESLMEHEKVTVFIECDRGVSHELVRHRIASFSQESTRYCNYSKDKFGNRLKFILPVFYTYGKCDEKRKVWEDSIKNASIAYLQLLKLGASPQEARAVLPNSLKTSIVITMNLREWRHFFLLRADEHAHPQMREIAIPLLLYFKKQLSPLFDDIPYDTQFNVSDYAAVFDYRDEPVEIVFDYWNEPVKI